jgi:hypothetical protein
MATTTNYGWTTPDDTALVKDGAAAIRTLGSSVDTTTKNLNPETTLGDIAYRSSTANVKTRLGLGTAGQVLQVNSGATAPEWGTISAGGLTLLSTTTLSGSSTSITGISSSYTNLLITVTDAVGQYDNEDVYLRVNTDTGNNYNNGYYRLFDTTSDGTNLFATSRILVARCTNSTSTIRKTNLAANIYNYTSTGTRFITSYSTTGLASTSNVTFSSGGAYIGGSAISSIQLTLSAGTWSSGTVLVYGAK